MAGFYHLVLVHPTRLPQRVVLCVFFAAIGIMKIMDLRSASGSASPLESGQPFMIPEVVLLLLAGVELAIAVFVHCRYWQVAVAAALVLLVAFWIVLIIRFVMAQPAACGCFGGLEVGYAGHFVLIAGLFFTGLSAIASPPRTDRAGEDDEVL